MARALLHFQHNQTTTMKKILFPAIAILILVSSCRTETIDCSPGYIDAYAVGFADYTALGGKMVRYVAATDSAVDSSGLYSTSPASDTIRLGLFMPGYDYKLKFSDTLIYVISNITLSGQKQQTIHRGFMDGKAYVCTEQVSSYDINGTRYIVSPSQQGYMYITK